MLLKTNTVTAPMFNKDIKKFSFTFSSLIMINKILTFNISFGKVGIGAALQDANFSKVSFSALMPAWRRYSKCEILNGYRTQS